MGKENSAQRTKQKEMNNEDEKKKQKQNKTKCYEESKTMNGENRLLHQIVMLLWATLIF